jgi:hypothetical protein
VKYCEAGQLEEKAIDGVSQNGKAVFIIKRKGKRPLGKYRCR